MMAKKKLTAYQKHMKRQIKAGKSFKQAASSWKGGKTKHLNSRRGAKYSMAKRKRTSSKKASGRFSLGNIGKMLKTAGMAFAIGAGATTAINYIGDLTGQPIIKQVAPLAGAYAAFQSGGTIGLVAALPLVQQSGLLNLGGQTNTQGVGAFT